ncbi:LytS/YhcK type 5TM receptor domain-containing protein [Celerinatantimonas sp. YJH-8]|uniref:LytS/YhcK type 5TM receptor domain-containing protein n=1 Tax=Celerinatantimonas sp. YJH-8 TaxID=3228714 RepID=UPI0038C19F87
MAHLPDYSLIISLAQQMSLFLVGAYLLSKTPLFTPIVYLSPRLSHRIFVYLLFSGLCILGTYFGQPVHDAIANTRAIGAVLGGLFGGPVVGFAVGLTAGLHRYSLGGFSALACAISTTCEGLLAGSIQAIVRHHHRRIDELFSPLLVFSVTFAAEALQMLILLIFAKPYPDALALVKVIALPMLIANPIGASLFMMMISDRKSLHDKFSRSYSQKALKLAQRIVGVLPDLTQQSAQQMAEILHQETGVAAVAITNREQVLAFVGTGSDHHLPNTAITSALTRKAIEENSIVFADGVQHIYRCSCSEKCPLRSVLVIPLRCADEVIGTVKLYESKRRLFLTINRTLGEGIAHIIEEQMVTSRYQQQQALLTQAKLKLVRAQIHPHFLFNALNTITAIIRKNPPQARKLIGELALFLRTSLKQHYEQVPLIDELRCIQAYLNIEQARFGERLQVDIDIPEAWLQFQIPSFTLQPLVENAIKHGISQILTPGHLKLYLQEQSDHFELIVEDNAGLYHPPSPETCSEQGLGLSIVRTRLRHQYGEQARLIIDCLPEQSTKVRIQLPRSGYV